jgi:hypothetical protein
MGLDKDVYLHCTLYILKAQTTYFGTIAGQYFVSGTKGRRIVIVSDTMNGFFFSTFPYLTVHYIWIPIPDPEEAIMTQKNKIKTVWLSGELEVLS